MDANGLRFWLLATAQDWHPLGELPQTQYDEECQALRLSSERLLPPWSQIDPTDTALESMARSRLELVPQTLDAFGTRAYWDATSRTIRATGALPGAIDILVPEQAPTDLAMGYDGVLYLAIANQVILQDRRDRWLPVFLNQSGFKPWRLAASPEGGVWVLDREQRQLARVQGLPLPTRAYGEFSPNVVRPCAENPQPPQLTVLPTATLPADETPVAIACSPQGRLALLTWQTAGRANLRLLTATFTWTPPLQLVGCRYPYSLTWVGSDRLAVLIASLPTEAPVYALPHLTSATPDTNLLQPVGDFYPLRDYDGSPFLHGVTQPPHYTTSTETVPLYPLSLASYARQGAAEAVHPFDSGSPRTEWHRLYLEAIIPATAGIQVYLAATDTPIRPDPASDQWYEHQFGDRFPPTSTLPRAAWVSQPSEIPFHPGLLSRLPQKDRVGLFTVLIQRSDRQVRTLRGRYLWVRVVLTGNGRTTPEMAALRAYASRFSYAREYLPSLYHEAIVGPDRDAIAPATPADFLDRLLANLEGILTPLEDRIASSYLLTDPRTTPDAALDWLASWIGMTFDPAYTPRQRRRLIEAAPDLYGQRGTLAGLQRMLDVITTGAVSRGEIVVLEDFRLRRTFATILGADLTETQDPLTAGLSISGNSYVGDTLFLGDETEKEFLAVFAADLPVSPAEAEAIAAFFDRLAYRVTVLVHSDLPADQLGLIRRVVDRETPAHILSRVVTASSPFLVSIASLIGVDTYLGAKPQPQVVRLGESQLGQRDLLQHPASLDPRLESGADPATYLLQRPVAEVAPSLTVAVGNSFQLDASASRAASGHQISRYIWTRLS
jgi:phage tail-like protein